MQWHNRYKRSAWRDRDDRNSLADPLKNRTLSNVITSESDDLLLKSFRRL